MPCSGSLALLPSTRDSSDKTVQSGRKFITLSWLEPIQIRPNLNLSVNIHLLLNWRMFPLLTQERSCGRFSVTRRPSRSPGIPRGLCWPTPAMTKRASMTATVKWALWNCLVCPMTPEMCFYKNWGEVRKEEEKMGSRTLQYPFTASRGCIWPPPFTVILIFVKVIGIKMMFFYIYTALLFIEFRKYKSLLISIWVYFIDCI